MLWKPDWPAARENHIRWWKREGMVLYLTERRTVPRVPIAQPSRPDTPFEARTSAAYRCDMEEHRMAWRNFHADALPYIDTEIGPGSLGTFLGSEPHFAWETVWYDKCIPDPDVYGPIRFHPAGNRWLDVHLAVVDEALRRARGRFFVGIPDLIENLDTLAAMRGTQEILMDAIDRPEWILDKLAEINEAYFAAFDIFYDRVRAADDGGSVFSAFKVWGPGRTAKVQCDISCMLSPSMFRQFVVPALAEQCDWLDFAMYHLDGEDALQHLYALLEIPGLDAIEWTPRRCWTGPEECGSSPKWFDLYRRIKAGGKSVQAISCVPEQVVPLLDAVGPEGMYLMVEGLDAATAERVLRDVEPYRKR